MTLRAPVIKIILRSCLMALWTSTALADTTVFAAASLRNALNEIREARIAQSGGRVIVSYAASSALARQIEKGAPADIFISADQTWMDYLAQRRLIIEKSRVNLLRNELVLIAPVSAKPSVIELKKGVQLGQLLGKDRMAMADPDHVPAGKYGKQALESLGLWPQVAGRLARGENVRTALNYVARAETPLGIVYRTDAAAEARVKVIAAFAADSHPPIVYPAALLAPGRNTDAAAFLAYLRSDAAAAIFRKHGFLTY